MIRIFVWWLVLGWFPTSSGAALAIASLRRYRGRRHGRYTRRYVALGGGAHRAARGGVSALVPEVTTPEREVLATRARIEARARAIEEARPDPTAEWVAELRRPVPGEVDRYDQAAGAIDYLRATERNGIAERPRFNRLDRITTAEMRLMFGDELASVLAPPVADEWLEPLEKAGV